MADVSLVKDLGNASAALTLHALAEYDYPGGVIGASLNLGDNHDEAIIHLTGSPDETDADTILSSIAKPTCTHSDLDITVNVGSYISNDVTSITADSSDMKCILVTLYVDDTTGDLEVVIFERTTDEYGTPPSGKSFAGELKEYSVPASGTELTEVENYI